MGFPAGVGRDFEALERRRMRAGSLLAKGLSQSEVARRVGAHRQSVSKWAAELLAKGRAGLKQAGRAGRKPRLSAEQINRIERGLKTGPPAPGESRGGVRSRSTGSSADSNAGRRRWGMKPACGPRTG